MIIDRNWSIFLTVLSSILLLFVMFVPLRCSAAEVWSDDFDDGNYNGWTVSQGGFTAADDVMRGTTSTWNWAYHNSAQANGTWSFDVYYMGANSFNVWFITNYLEAGSYYRPWDGYFIQFRHTGEIQLKRDSGGGQTILDQYTPPGGLDGWWHIDVTRDLTGVTTVYVNGTMRIQATDTTFDTTSWFFFEAYNTQAIDNIVVDDSAIAPPTSATTTTTTTPATITTTTTPATTSVAPPLDPMMTAAGAGIGAVAILGIIFVSRRRKQPRKGPEIPPTEPFAPILEEVPVVVEAGHPPTGIAPTKQVVDIPAEKTVKVLRGGEIIGGKFEYKIKVKNDTDYVINNVTVTIIAYPEDCLDLPENPMKTIKRIGPGEFRSPQFTFIPTKDCVEGKVIATVSYIDHQDKTKMLGSEPYVIRSVCDLLIPLESTIEDFDLILGDMAATSDERVTDWNPEVLFTKAKALLPAKNFYILDSSSRIENGQFVSEIRGLAEGKYTGKKVAVRLTISGLVDGNQASVRVEGLGDDEAMLPTTIDELTKGIDSWICMNCGAGFEPMEVDAIRDGRAIQCKYCRRTMTIDLYRR